MISYRPLLAFYFYQDLSNCFSKFYRRHYELLISKFIDGLKTLLREGLSEPEFYDDMIYKCKKLIGRNDFYFHFRKNHYTLQTYRIYLIKCETTVCMQSF